MWVIKCDVGYFKSPGQGVTESFEMSHKYSFSEMELAREEDSSIIKIGSNRHISELKVEQEFNDDDDWDDWDEDDDFW
ncbi:hypothetical protein PQC39_gp075 [Vibrio phage Vp_R1]|uniref:Uncharacterized protein n=1 Tax=Vibrio phage Vp_R1 TaxID=2059867 RepID=A0A2H5BQ31_9CAUD|nr:hypothetical protein PQC39_gp075 [Vibrio phage Vp_R1]AUG88439.1 hypothetical protein VPR_075 [Vibrio phage Vp_R1]